jgi:hypothetical protein
MSSDPAHDRVEIMHRLGFRRGRPAHDDDFDSKRARCFDLGVGRAAAAVLGHQRLHPFVAHKRDFVSERERSAREDQLMVRQGVDLGRVVDRPDDVATLWRSREGRELQPALREEDCPRARPESVDGLIDCRDLDPAIAALWRPSRSGEDDKRRIGRSAGSDRVRGHARSERMRRVDDGVDALADKKSGQACHAAEAADALGNRRLSRIGGRPCERQQGRNIRLVGQPPRERARLRRAAENEQTKAIQWAAP